MSCYQAVDTFCRGVANSALAEIAQQICGGLDDRRFMRNSDSKQSEA